MQRSVLIYRVTVDHEHALGESDRIEVTEVMVDLLGTTTDHDVEIVSVDLDEYATGDGSPEDLITN